MSSEELKKPELAKELPRKYRYLSATTDGKISLTEPIDPFNIRGVIKSLKDLADDNNL